MIRAVLSAHLAPHDLRRLLLLMNKRSLGALATTEGHSFVMPAMQDCHLIVVVSEQLKTMTREDGALLLRRWEQHFKRAQSMNLGAFLAYLAKEKTPCDMLMIASSEIILAFQDRRQGLYLNRAEQLFRLQPTVRPPQFPLKSYLDHLDFYAVKPRQNDLILCIEPSFIKAFDPLQLEEVFNEGSQVMGTLQDLIQNLKTYEPNYEISWLALEVNRVEENAVYLSNRDDAAFVDSMKDRRKHSPLGGLLLSRVSRVLYGQELLPVKANPSDASSPERRLPDDLPKVQAKPKRLPRQPLGRMQEELRRQKRPDLMKGREDRRAQREKNLRRYARRQKPKEKFFDRLQEFSFDPWIKRIKTFPKRMFHLVPGNPMMSKIVGATIILLFLVFLLLLWMRMRRQPEMIINETEPSFSQTKEALAPELKAVPPEVTNLELSHVLKSNNLQIRQHPDAQAPLIATAMRGDVVVQLAEPENGWVYVRLESSQTEGYAFAEYLLEQAGGP